MGKSNSAKTPQTSTVENNNLPEVLYRPNHKRIVVIVSVILFLLILCTLFVSYLNYNIEHKKYERVVPAPQSPYDSVMEIFPTKQLPPIENAITLTMDIRNYISDTNIENSMTGIRTLKSFTYSSETKKITPYSIEYPKDWYESNHTLYPLGNSKNGSDLYFTINPSGSGRVISTCRQITFPAGPAKYCWGDTGNPTHDFGYATIGDFSIWVNGVPKKDSETYEKIFNQMLTSVRFYDWKTYWTQIFNIDWKKYSLSESPYTFKHPPSTKIDKYNTGYGEFDTYFDDFCDTCLRLTIYTSPDVMPTNFAYDNGNGKNETIKPYSINGYTGIRGREVVSKDIVLLNNPNGGYVALIFAYWPINGSHDDPIKDEAAKVIFNQILSTFKFIDKPTITPQLTSSSNWNTYTDNRNTFSFSYPSTWLLQHSYYPKENITNVLYDNKHIIAFSLAISPKNTSTNDSTAFEQAKKTAEWSIYSTSGFADYNPKYTGSKKVTYNNLVWTVYSYDFNGTSNNFVYKQYLLACTTINNKFISIHLVLKPDEGNEILTKILSTFRFIN